MGTPDFAAVSLEALVAAGHEVCGVLTQPDKPRNRNKVTYSAVKEAALAHSIPVYQPSTTKDDATHTQHAVPLPEATAPDVHATDWRRHTGWQDLEDDLGGAYRMISTGTPQAQGLTALRTYAQTHVKWVNRYSLN